MGTYDVVSNPDLKIIGLTGPKFTGKSTVADHLVKHYGFTVLHFATPTKVMLKAVFGINYDRLTPDQKEEGREDLGGLSPRKVLQTFGTEYLRRKLSEDMLVRIARKSIRKKGQYVFDDLRFNNEAVMIKEMGGTIIHLHRTLDKFQRDPHESENGVSPAFVDCHIDLDGKDANGKVFASIIRHALKAFLYGVNITNKLKGYEIYEAGGFGNKLRTWTSVDAYLKDAPPCSVSLRYKLPQSKFCAFNLTEATVESTVSKWLKQGADRSLIQVNESAPDERLILQGEFMQDERYGYVLTFSAQKVKMRDAMKHPRTVAGPGALAVLKTVLTPGSYDDIVELLDRYPMHVIEFSAYEINVGTCRGRNTVIWEVRLF